MKGWEILKRAWSMVWRFRALWIIGAIVALSPLSWEGALLMGGGDLSEPKTEEHGILVPLPSGARIVIPGRGGKGEDPGRLILNYKHAADSVPLVPGDVVVNYDPPDRLSVNVGTRQRNGSQTRHTLPVEPATVRLIKIGLAATAALGVIVGIAAAIARYVGEAALIRMVDAYEETGVRRSLRQGLRLGWSRTAWKLFLINASIRIPAALLLTGAFLLALSPLAITGAANATGTAIAVALSIAMLLVGLLVLPALMIALSVLTRLARQACAVDGMGVVGSIGAALTLLRAHLSDVAMMWMQMLGVRIVWDIAGGMVGLVVVIIAGLAGAIPALLTGGLGALLGGGTLLTPGPWIVGGLVGLIVFLVVLKVPMAFFGGLREVLQSSAWTLTYRQLSS